MRVRVTQKYDEIWLFDSDLVYIFFKCGRAEYYESSLGRFVKSKYIKRDNIIKFRWAELITEIKE